MTRPQKAGVVCALGLAAVSLILTISIFVGGQGEGEVSAILYGAFIMMGLIIAGYFGFVAPLAAVWQMRWIAA